MKRNEVCIEGETTIILVESDVFGNRGILIDTEDYDKIKEYCWHIVKHQSGFYAQANYKNKKMYMHRLIKTPPANKVIDHRNGNTLDNRKCNLRICTHKENMRNLKVNVLNKSGYRHIHKVNSRDLWEVQIKKKRIGQFELIEEAVKARNKYLIENMQDELFFAYDRQ